MFSISKKFIRLPDKLLEVKRVFSEDRIKNIDGVKEWLNTPIVMRKDGLLFFCTEIEEAQILEEEIVEEQVIEEEIKEEQVIEELVEDAQIILE